MGQSAIDQEKTTNKGPKAIFGQIKRDRIV